MERSLALPGTEENVVARPPSRLCALTAVLVSAAAFGFCARMTLAPLGYTDEALKALVGVHALAGALAVMLALGFDRAARWLRFKAPRRFALAFVIIFSGFIVLPAFAGWLPTWSYFEQWGEPLPWRYWILRNIFSLAGGTASYITTTLTPMMPAPLLLALAAALGVTLRRVRSA